MSSRGKNTTVTEKEVPSSILQIPFLGDYADMICQFGTADSFQRNQQVAIISHMLVVTHDLGRAGAPYRQIPLHPYRQKNVR